MSQNVIGMYYVGLAAFGAKTLAQLRAKEIADGRNTSFLLSEPRNVPGGLDAEHGHARALVILKKITVVAGYFYDKAFRAQPAGTD